MICTVSLASRPEEEMPALSAVLTPAPEASQQTPLRRQEEAFLEEVLQFPFSPLPGFSAFDYPFSVLLLYE